MHEIVELRKQGMSIQAISRMPGWDRKTVRKDLLVPEGVPTYSRLLRNKLGGFVMYPD